MVRDCVAHKIGTILLSVDGSVEKMGSVAESAGEERSLRVSTTFTLGVENERTDAGLLEGCTRFARPNSKPRTRTEGKNNFHC